ncbi:UNVERIFIED_CONTAM: hypothetical protein Slati_3534500 [Sesamum latifolium]|uniref:Uncharacterized protein n=1 Tax=Sesamum latifolium TaxID=2727402 RepID=A0AAW2UNM7_9LAMI
MMPKLRHLCVTPCSLHVPRNMQILVLENLHTLSEVCDLRWSNDILKRVPNLKVLGISYNVSDATASSEFRLGSLVNLHQLETLKLVFKYSFHASLVVKPPKLAFPKKLRKLTLAGCGIPWSSMNACHGFKWEPVDGQFCELKHLLLEEVDIVQWEANDAHFPRLQRLIIRSCYKLKEIPSDIGDITTLEMIELVDCHPSAKKIQDEQEDKGNEDLKIRTDSRRHFKNKFLLQNLSLKGKCSPSA